MTFVEAEDEDEAASLLVAFADLADLLDGQQTTGALDARLRAVVAAAPVVLFATDASGLLTLWEGRATRHVGHPAGEIVGRSMFEVFGESRELVAGMRRAIDGEGFTEDGEIEGHPYRIRYSPVFERGRVAGVIGLAVDIGGQQPAPPPPPAPAASELIEEQPSPEPAPLEQTIEPDIEALEAALPALGELIPELTEVEEEDEPADIDAEEDSQLDIGTGEFDLSSLGDLLGDIEESAPVTEERFEITPVGLDELSALDLPSISPVQADDDEFPEPPAVEPARPAMDLWEQVDRALDEIAPDKPVATNRDGSQAKAFGDPDAVLEILSGLIENAERHGGPQITLRIDRLGDDLALSVIDDGPGLPTDIWSGVFGVEAGAGSELAVLRGRAVSIGGQLTYDYRRGHSIFTLSLPAV